MEKSNRTFLDNISLMFYNINVVSNSRGDVELIYNNDNSLLARYYYDAWGNIIDIQNSSGTTITSSNHIANINPIRYRGYYYDTETGFYYLSSRYYNPEIGRFINADMQLNTDHILGYNMFAYCVNNPVMYMDHTGTMHVRGIDACGGYGTSKTTKNKDYYTIKYDVPLYNQGDTNLCWAYSQAMIEDAKTKTKRTQEEANERAREIAVEAHGETNWNQSGRPENLSKIKTKSLYDIYRALKEHGPLYTSYGKYEGNQRIGGHAIVVTGVNLIEGRIYTNNPWGITGDQTYKEFLDVFEGIESGSGWKLDSCYYLN